jgi:hypothetical protein
LAWLILTGRELGEPLCSELSWFDPCVGCAAGESAAINDLGSSRFCGIAAITVTGYYSGATQFTFS